MAVNLIVLLVGLTTFGMANVCRHPQNVSITRPPSFLGEPYDRIDPRPFRIKIVYTDAFLRLSNHYAVKEQLVEPSLRKFEQLFRTRIPKRGKHYIYPGCTNNNHHGFKKDENGVMQHYCVKGCDSRTLCYDTLAPSHIIGECRQSHDGKLYTARRGGEGADADFIMIVTSEVTNLCSGNLMAYAIACQTEKGTDRPDVGMINLCPHSIRLEKSGIKSSMGTVMHEAMHAMGFAESHLAFFRDSTGKPLTPRDPRTGYPNLGFQEGVYKPSEKVLKLARRRWLSKAVDEYRTVKILVTPTILKVAREHYGCLTLDGVDIESQGGTATSGSHFEKRTLMNEIMTGSVSENPVFSKISLAFFQDSGWYDVDLSKGAPLNWGKGLGCDFVYQSCYEYMYRKHKARQPPFPWCDRLKYTFKHKQYGNYYGRCSLRQNLNNIAPEFYNINYLPNVPREKWYMYTGDEELADHCPYIKE